LAVGHKTNSGGKLFDSGGKFWLLVTRPTTAEKYFFMIAG